MGPYRHFFVAPLVALWVLFGFFLLPIKADEPRATFTIKKGWVQASVRQDGKPVVAAVLQVQDSSGNLFAEGETDQEGTASFPFPGGHWVSVELKTGKRTADPIRLFNTREGIEPSRVLLSYGLRPCCRSKQGNDAVRNPQLVDAQPGQNLADAAGRELQRRQFRALSDPLKKILEDPRFEPIPTQASSLLLQTAPEFTLPDVDGKNWSLADQVKQGPVVLVFYYGYFCDHCVSQLFGINMDLEKFHELNAQVLAISADPPELTKDRYRQYGAFRFPVLADVGNKIAEKYEVFVPLQGKEGDLVHGTFIIDQNRKVIWSNRGETPFLDHRTLLLEIARKGKR